MLAWWTIGRASGIGAVAGLVALIVWPFYSGAGDPVEWPFAACAAIALVCGLSILTITGLDIAFHRRRGREVRPLRAFDLILATGLIALSWVQIDSVAGQLPAAPPAAGVLGDPKSP
jgi:hypothetical protein